MSDLPPNIDAILASIRSRMSEEPGAAPPVDAAPPAPRPPLAEARRLPEAPLADPGAVVVGGAAGAMTLEALVRSMLEPMLQAWLDANMPELVEGLAQAEIKRLTGHV